MKFCGECGNPIPADRQKKRAKTCSKECQIAYRKSYMDERRAIASLKAQLEAMKRVERERNSVLTQAEVIGE
jgi:endogenous inhibitor of DNA gyrase (YacG/DUF329 family)